MDSSLHLVPGRYKLPTTPGRSLRKDSPGWEKAENKFTATSGPPACVCVCVYFHATDQSAEVLEPRAEAERRGEGKRGGQEETRGAGVGLSPDHIFWIH